MDGLGTYRPKTCSFYLDWENFLVKLLDLIVKGRRYQHLYFLKLKIFAIALSSSMLFSFSVVHSPDQPTVWKIARYEKFFVLSIKNFSKANPSVLLT